MDRNGDRSDGTLPGAGTLSERALSSQIVYDGKILRLRRDRVSLPGGGDSIREVVEHIGGVGVLALDDDDNVLLVRQFRYAVGREVLEIPAGTLRLGEQTEDCAARELREETGAAAGRVRWLGRLAPEPAFCDQHLYLYLAQDLTFGPQQLDEDEYLTVLRMPFSDLLELVLQHKVEDAKTVVAVLKAALLLQREQGNRSGQTPAPTPSAAALESHRKKH